MAADFADTVHRFISSPPGQLVAGGTLAGIVWKFFERVEAVLTDQTKFAIAVWLVGVSAGRIIEPWPDTFARIFDRVFGQKHLSWKCFSRSCLLSIFGMIVSFLVALLVYLPMIDPTLVRTFMAKFDPSQITGARITIVLVLILLMISVCCLIDYVSLLKTRWAIRLTKGLAMGVLRTLMIFLIDGLLGLMLVVVSTILLSPLTGIANLTSIAMGSIWLWLYGLCGFLLIVARRVDPGFQWFNSKFDIEKKPLQAIGLVAGAVVAVMYWSLALTARFMHV